MGKPTNREELTWIVVFRLSCVAGVLSCLFGLYGLCQIVIHWNDDDPYYAKMLIVAAACIWCSQSAVTGLLKDLEK